MQTWHQPMKSHSLCTVDSHWSKYISHHNDKVWARFRVMVGCREWTDLPGVITQLCALCVNHFHDSQQSRRVCTCVVSAAHTHRFRLERRLDLFVLQFFPVDVTEEGVLLDVPLALWTAAQTLARVLGHQLDNHTHTLIKFICKCEKLFATFSEPWRKTAIRYVRKHTRCVRIGS